MKPPPVFRNGVLSIMVPEVLPKTCRYCVFETKDGDGNHAGCSWGIYTSKKGCSSNHSIFIESSDAAWASYIAQKLEGT